MLHAAALALAGRLAASKDAAARWVGKDALRDLSRPLIAARVAEEVRGGCGAGRAPGPPVTAISGRR